MKFKDNVTQKNNLDYLKLKNGESAMGVFKGDPYEFYQVYPSNDPVPAGTKGAAFRFKINFVTKEGATYVAKAFSQGVTIYNRLKYLNESYNLEETVVKITRKGSTKDDTEYYIDAVGPKAQPTQAGWNMINKVELLDLMENVAKATKEPAFDPDVEPWPEQAPPEEFHDEIPF